MAEIIARHKVNYCMLVTIVPVPSLFCGLHVFTVYIRTSNPTIYSTYATIYSTSTYVHTSNPTIYSTYVLLHPLYCNHLSII